MIGGGGGEEGDWAPSGLLFLAGSKDPAPTPHLGPQTSQIIPPSP